MQELALITFVFPDSMSTTPRTAPKPHQIRTPPNASARVLPCSSNPLSPISQDSTIAYSLPFSKAPDFLAASQEIPVTADISQSRSLEDGSSREEKMWIMKAVKNGANGSGGLQSWARNAWTDFVDLIKVY